MTSVIGYVLHTVNPRQQRPFAFSNAASSSSFSIPKRHFGEMQVLYGEFLFPDTCETDPLINMTEM